MDELEVIDYNDVIVLEDNLSFIEEENEIEHTKTIRNKFKKQDRKYRKVNYIVEENTKLKKENDVLKALCGYRPKDYILEAIVTIQSATRGWILRHDKKNFYKSVSLFLDSCRMFLIKKKYKKLRHAAINVQKIYRGNKIRSTLIGKAVGKLINYRRDLLNYELAILRLEYNLYRKC